MRHFTGRCYSKAGTITAALSEASINPRKKCDERCSDGEGATEEQKTSTFEPPLPPQFCSFHLWKRDSSVHSWERVLRRSEEGESETKSLLFHTCSQKVYSVLPAYLKEYSLFSFCTQKIHRDRFHLKIYSMHCVPEKIDSVLQLKNPAS